MMAPCAVRTVHTEMEAAVKVHPCVAGRRSLAGARRVGAARRRRRPAPTRLPSNSLFQVFISIAVFIVDGCYIVIKVGATT